jgi:hypothetical protein
VRLLLRWSLNDISALNCSAIIPAVKIPTASKVAGTNYELYETFVSSIAH